MINKKAISLTILLAATAGLTAATTAYGASATKPTATKLIDT